jgi:basic membrane protein A
MKKILGSTLAIIVLCAGCASEGGQTGAQLKGILVTDSGGANDKSFNQGTNEGLFAYAKAHPDEWIASQAIESRGPQDYKPNLNSAADENDLVIAAGFLIQDAMVAAAQRNANRKFLGIDMDMTMRADMPTNLQTYVFADEQSGYLAGVAAGLQTKTNKVGFIGGEEVPPVQRFGWGFIAGVRASNPAAEILYEYAGSFSDVALGTQKGQAMYNTGIDVIFAVAGGTGIGVINETMNQRQAGKDAWVIGVDRDQYDEGLIAGTGKSVVLTSAVKKVGQAAQMALKEITDGTFEGGRTTRLSLKEGAVGLPDENPNLTTDIAAEVARIEQKIKTGDIIVPDTRDAVDGTNVIGRY